jgi:hypothetical protein
MNDRTQKPGFPQNPLASGRFFSDIEERASLAQLVEQLTLNQRVVGSSPTGGTPNYPVSTKGLRLQSQALGGQSASQPDLGLLTVPARIRLAFASCLSSRHSLENLMPTFGRLPRINGHIEGSVHRDNDASAC